MELWEIYSLMKNSTQLTPAATQYLHLFFASIMIFLGIFVILWLLTKTEHTPTVSPPTMQSQIAIVQSTPTVLPQPILVTIPPKSSVTAPTKTLIATQTPSDLLTEVTPSQVLATATKTLWPTTDPKLLGTPPIDIDLSQSHLWFRRPINSNNAPSIPYRFGMTYNQKLVPHRAVDIAESDSTPIVAVGSGTIYFAGTDNEVQFGPQLDFYGYTVVLELDTKWQGHTIYALYGHLASISVASGQTVNSGDELGTVGNSGIATATHLHFEIRQNNPHSYSSVRNPELWYQPLAGWGVLAGRVIDANGHFLPGVRVNLMCRDNIPRYVETYWDQHTPPDDVLGENFVISDLPSGTCRIWAEPFGRVVEKTVDIQSGELAFVVLVAQQ